MRGLIPHDECRKCALNPLHPCELTPDILEEIREDPNHRHADPDSFSPSYLLGCDRQAALTIDNDWWVDVLEAWPMVRGSMIHSRMENAGYPGVVGFMREIEFMTEVQTRYGLKKFFGTVDLVVVLVDSDECVQVKIVDYKSKGSIGHDLTAALRENVMQINMYKWLVERELPKLLKGHPRVEVVELEFFYGDMQKPRRFTSAGPLQTRGKMTNRSPKEYATLDLEPVPMLDSQVIEKWVIKHIEAKIKAMHEELPPILEGDASWKCRKCPIREFCYSLEEQDG